MTQQADIVSAAAELDDGADIAVTGGIIQKLQGVTYTNGGQSLDTAVVTSGASSIATVNNTVANNVGTIEQTYLSTAVQTLITEVNTGQKPDSLTAVNYSVNTNYQTRVTIDANTFLTQDLKADSTGGYPITMTISPETSGTASLVGSNWVFTPDNNFSSGTEGFEVTLKDGQNTTEVFFNLNVGPAPAPTPVASDPPPTNYEVSTNYETSLTLTSANILAGMHETNPTIVSIKPTTNNGSSVAQSGSNWTFTPVNGAIDTQESFSVSLSDGYTGTVLIDIQGNGAVVTDFNLLMGQAPTLAVYNSYASMSGTTLAKAILESSTFTNFWANNIGSEVLDLYEFLNNGIAPATYSGVSITGTWANFVEQAYSTSGNGTGLTNSQAVIDDYSVILGRQADLSSYASYIQYLAAGNTNANLQGFFFISQEFTSDYSIVSGVVPTNQMANVINKVYEASSISSSHLAGIAATPAQLQLGTQDLSQANVPDSYHDIGLGQSWTTFKQSILTGPNADPLVIGAPGTALPALLSIGAEASVNGGLDGTGPMGVGSSRVDLQACKLEYSIVSPK